MHSRFVRWSSLAMVALVLAAAHPSRADGVEPGPLSGTWRYGDGAHGLRRVDEAVEHAIRGMPFFLVPIARDMVRGRTIHFDELRIDVDDGVVRFATEGWGPVISRIGAPPMPITAPEGTHLELSHRLDAGRLVQRFEHPDGLRENVFAPSGDGEWLWMTVRIASPQLPRECRYRLRYRRASRAVAAR